jgi:putative Mn2+ efflux pump MntP
VVLIIIKFIVTFFTLFILSLTLSADDFSVGVAYGLFKIKIPIKTLIITVLGSATSTWGVMLIGKFIFKSMPDYIADWTSAIILFGIGCKMIYNGWKQKNDAVEFANDHPLDFNVPKSVSIWETYIVGLGLGVDDFAQALGLAVAGFPIVLTVILLELAELIAILSGNYLAFKGFSKKVNGRLSIIPGIVLLLVALYEILS